MAVSARLYTAEEFFAYAVMPENSDRRLELVDGVIFRKACEYLQAGVRMVWAVYPDEHMVYVMTLEEQGGILSLPFGMGDTLDGGDVLPDFQLAVRDIFPD
jgi:Uma2 family endonuclease